MTDRIQVPRRDDEPQISLSADAVDAIATSVLESRGLEKADQAVRDVFRGIIERTIIETVDVLEAEGWCGLDFHVSLPAGDGEICSYCEQPITEHPRVPVCLPGDDDDPHRAAILDAAKGIFLP